MTTVFLKFAFLLLVNKCRPQSPFVENLELLTLLYIGCLIFLCIPILRQLLLYPLASQLVSMFYFYLNSRSLFIACLQLTASSNVSGVSALYTCTKMKLLT